MLTLPDAIVAVLMPFATLFSKPTWSKAQLLLVGAVLTTGQRTVAQALRVMGRSHHYDYARYHEVLNRAVWSPRRSARILLGLLLEHFGPSRGPLVFGIDETLERRRGPRIKAKGTYRDAARSHRGHVVKASGLRWISLMLDLPDVAGTDPRGGPSVGIAPAHRAGALGTLLPSPGSPAQETHRLGPAADPATASVAARPRPGGSGRRRLCRFGPAELLPRPVPTGNLHHPPAAGRPSLRSAPSTPTPPAGTVPHHRPTTNLPGPIAQSSQHALDHGVGGLVRRSRPYRGTDLPHRPLVRLRQAALAHPLGAAPRPPTPVPAQARLCTDPNADPAQIVQWFVLRWQLEVTFREVRAHLGVETQRQWSHRAIARTTPVLLGLFSWVTLAAHQLQHSEPMPCRAAAWYPKPQPTFSDALALVRCHLWPATEDFPRSLKPANMAKSQLTRHHKIITSLAYA